MNPPTKSQDSFLFEAQRFGKANGKLEISDIDSAIESVHEIIDKEAQAHFRSIPEEQWETVTLAVYCHDCHAIVTPVIKKMRKKNRNVCGTCESKKISMGRKEALEQFYHLDRR